MANADLLTAAMEMSETAASKKREYRVVRYRREHDIVHGVTGSPGRKYTPIVHLDDSGVVRLSKVPNDEATKWFSDLPYPLKRVTRNLIKAGRTFGISKEAKEFLKEIE